MTISDKDFAAALAKKDRVDRVIVCVYSIALTKLAMGQQPRIGAKDFRAILGRRGIPARAWFRMGREFQTRGICTMSSRSLLISLNDRALRAVYGVRPLRHKSIAHARP